MANFNLRKFLTENKLTTNSRLAEERGGTLYSVFEINGGFKGYTIEPLPDFTQSLTKEGVADYVMDVYYKGDSDDFEEWIEHTSEYDYDEQDYIYGNFTDEAFVVPLDEVTGLLVIEKGIAVTSEEEQLVKYYKDIAL